MRGWSLNWGEVTPYLVVGSCPRTPDDICRIREEADATALLSLQHDDCLNFLDIDEVALYGAGQEVGLRMVRCPIRDFDPQDARRVLPVAVRILAELRCDGSRTYVHCTAGLGRAPVTVWAYLVFGMGYEESRAYQLLKQARPEAIPAWEALQGCRDDMVEQHRSTIERRAHDLYQEGMSGDRDTHWNQAVAEVLQSVFSPY